MNYSSKKDKEREQKLEKLRGKYQKYMLIVVTQMSIALEDEGYNPDDIIGDIVDSGYDFLLIFQDYLDWVCQYRIYGKPDSFIVAACLMYSLATTNYLLEAYEPDDVDGIEDAIKYQKLNVNIALNCALEVISEPHTYYEDDDGDWIKEKYPKVEITIPEGLIKNSPLRERIVNEVFWELYVMRPHMAENYNFLEVSASSIMPLSNLLHLLYLMNAD